MDGDILTITNHPSPTAISLAPFTGNNTDEQELSMNGDTLFISNGNNVLLPYDSSNWVINGNTMYYNGGNVGIGSSTPVSNLEVKGTAVTSDALFQVINSNNDTVFAVYPDGVKIFVDSEAKGKVGGFAISGRSPSKAGNVEIFRANIDSTRIYVSDTVSSKGKVGGFAISGRSPSKGVNNDYLLVTGDSTRIYINDTSTVKGKVGGFAISGRSPSKGSTNDYLQVTKDSTRVYILNPSIDNSLGGFAVREKNSLTNSQSDYMNIGRYNSKIYSMSQYDNQEYTSWNLLVENISKFTDTVKLMKASYGNLSMTIPYGEFFGKITSTPKFEVLGKVPSKGSQVKFLSIGSDNTSIGTGALIGIIGSDNIFIGNEPNATNYQCGDENIVIGYNYDAYGDEFGCFEFQNNNVLIGSGMNVKGEHNICLGSYAGSGGNSLTPGNYNVLLGYKAGGSNTDGSANILLGKESAYLNTTGNSNGIIGNSAGYSVEGSYNIMIGEQAGYWETGSNSFYLDNIPRTNLADQQAKALFYGQFNVNPLSQFLQINARLGIGGLWNPSYALYITGDAAATGNITATSFIATMSGEGAYMYNTTDNMTVPDYVFDHHLEGKSTQNPNYEMLSISDLKQYINKNRHLPRVPSRTEIEKDGAVNLQGLSMITLEKVEENTLYIIELEEKSIQQQQIIESQREEILEMKNRLTEIEKLLMAK